jgi:carotenoid cleavage dioxygenase-like enzyme
VTVIDPEAKVRSARRITLGGSTSLHDCAITERFVVLLDLPGQEFPRVDERRVGRRHRSPHSRHL